MNFHKLFITFCKPEDVEKTLAEIAETYPLPHRKMWLLESPDTTENMITYNIADGVKLQHKNTLIVHRQRSSNTLYTINGINTLIEQTTGRRDRDYRINWSHYKHYYIGAKSGELQLYKTHLKEIIEY